MLQQAFPIEFNVALRQRRGTPHVCSKRSVSRYAPELQPKPLFYMIG